MRQIVFVGLIFGLVLGCNKEEFNEDSISLSNSVDETLQSDQVIENDAGRKLKSMGTVYAMFSCEIDGKSGCQCDFAVDDDDCEELTPCIPFENLTYLDQAVHAIYSQAEIDSFYLEGIPFTNPLILDAARLDGLPIKD